MSGDRSLIPIGAIPLEGLDRVRAVKVTLMRDYRDIIPWSDAFSDDALKPEPM
jgi:hypothetical protein